MSSRRTVRLSIELLDDRELPSASATSSSVAVSKGADQHYSWIRVAELAYTGTPVGPFEKTLLKNSVDLVVPNAAYLNEFNSLAPNTPQMIYTNVSNIYGNLLMDWLNYADTHGYSREGAFYHVAQATPFTGNSGSSKPVDWFWSIQRGSDAMGWSDFTQASTTPPPIQFAAPGQSVVIGYPEQFREIDINLAKAGLPTWGATLEYATTRNAQGQPTGWKPLRTITNTTHGLRSSGTITFDPPSDWKPSSINGSAMLYYIRFRTTGEGTAPTAKTIMGRDYVNAHGTSSGTIPAFDYSADWNHDGYLSDAEYAHRKPGDNARFIYESRLFYPAYGQMRFATNPANGGFRNWAVDYARRFLAANPGADGLFLDNSIGRLQVDPADLRESIAKYSDDYASLVGSINSGIGSKWVLANTAGSGTSEDPLAKYGISYLEEFALRPLTATWQQFLDMAAQTAHRFDLMGPNGYAILDTYPAGGSPTDPRTQLAELAYYYMLADPKRTFIMFNGGYAPSSDWSQHWTNAVTYNVGQPRGTWSIFDQGKDPERPYLKYEVYSRTYDHALVLYKPLSYASGHTGTTDNATSTVERLPGHYRQLNADGTLGPVVNYVRLRNGEGAIMVPA